MNTDIAITILQQLGGNRFIAMTGAKNLVNHGDALSFKFPKPRDRRVNYCKVTLSADDTYSVEFGYIRGLKYQPDEPIQGVYNDQLQPIFTDKTGLYTRL